jgi:hypothetical protein
MLGDKAHFRTDPLFEHPEKIEGPIFTVAFPGDGISQQLLYVENRRLNAAVARRVEGTEFFELKPDNVAELPKAMADQWRRIELFLNNALYDYRVKVGTPRVIPGAAKVQK